MTKNSNLDEIKVRIPKELKAKFSAKVKKASKSQTGVIKSLIHTYVNS